ncbi:MAG TPA: response regulator, partial [Herpetosiphonaceae bacterium]
MKRILLIDDDPLLLSTLAGQLEAAGYETTRAGTLDHGRRSAADNPPDLAILEVAISRGAGWGLLNELVAHECRVLVLSRLGGADDLARALRAGATDVVTKPYHAQELLARVNARLTQAPPGRSAHDFAEPAAEPAEPHAAADRDARPVDERAAAEALPLGARLRTARKRRNISLVQANLETKIQMYY